MNLNELKELAQIAVNELSYYINNPYCNATSFCLAQRNFKNAFELAISQGVVFPKMAIDPIIKQAAQINCVKYDNFMQW